MDVQSSIIYPPSSGWPNMTPEVMACLGKDDEVIALLRQLPYPEDRPYSERPDCLPNDSQFQDWKTSADRLKNGKYDKDDLLYGTEGDVHRFGNRIPKYCVGLLDVVTERGDGIENVMLLDVTDGLVYWMDCPKHVLEVCEPKPSDPNEVEVVQDESVGVIALGEGGQSDDEASDIENLQRLTMVMTRTRRANQMKKRMRRKRKTLIVPTLATLNGDHVGRFATFSPCSRTISCDLTIFLTTTGGSLTSGLTETPGGLKISEPLLHRLQSVYRSHGWPNLEVYKKGDCLVELKQVLEKEFPDFH